MYPDINTDPYYQHAKLPDFNFLPDPNDPELALLKSEAQARGADVRRSNLNELARAGLIGTGTAMDALNSLDTNQARQMEDIQSQVYGKQRNQQLDLYKMTQQFRNELEMLRLQAMIAKQNQPLDLSGLGSLLGLGASLFTGGAGAGVTGPLMGQAGFQYPLLGQ